MKTLITLFITISLIIAGYSAHAAPIDGKLEKQLAKQRSDYIQGMLKERAGSITQYYAADVRIMTEANPTIFGRDNASLVFEHLFAQYEGIRYEREPMRTLDMGEYIAELGSYTLKAKNRQNDSREIEGKYLNLWKRSDDGYEIIADIWNFSHGIDFKHEMQFDHIPSIVTAMEAHEPINTPIALELAAYGALSDATIKLRDGDVIGQFYSDDAIVLSNYRQPIIGGEAIRDHWRTYAKELAGFETLQSRSDKIIPAGDYTIQFSSHIAAWRYETNSGVSTGKHIRIWKRQAHGGIRTLVLISAYDK